MKRKQLVIFDENLEYLEKLVSELNKKNNCIFEIIGYNNFDIFIQYIKNNENLIILTSKDINIDNLKNFKIIKLLEIPSDDGIYKYQSVDKILKNIMQIYCDNNKENLNYNYLKKSKFKVFLSLNDDKESLFEVLNIIKQSNKKSLFICLSSHCRDYSLYDDNKFNMLDLIYYSKSNKGISVEQLYQLIKEKNEISYIPVTLASIEYNIIPEKDWENIFEQLIFRSNFEEIIVFMGINIQGFVNFVKNADESIIVLSDKDDIYNTKLCEAIQLKGIDFSEDKLSIISINNKNIKKEYFINGN